MGWAMRGAFATQHNRTMATHGHVDVGDFIAGLISLNFEGHQRFFSTRAAADTQLACEKTAVRTGG